MTDRIDPRGGLSVDIAAHGTAVSIDLNAGEHGATALATAFVSVTLAVTGAPRSGALLAVAAAGHAIAWWRSRRAGRSGTRAIREVRLER